MSVLIAGSLLALVSCGDDSRTLRPAGPDQTQSIVDPTTTTVATTFTLSGPWPDGGQIEPIYTCKGADVSPPLRWAAVPEATIQLAIIVTDPDAGNFVHWVLTGLDPIVTSLAEGRAPEGSIESVNAFGKVGWNGPCPPSGRHSYKFELVALDEVLTIEQDTPVAEVIADIRANSIAVAVYTGVFGG